MKLTQMDTTSLKLTGGHDSSSIHMNEFLLSEVDLGAHDSYQDLIQVQKSFWSWTHVNSSQ